MKITEDVPPYAAEYGMTEKEALNLGFDEKEKKCVEA